MSGSKYIDTTAIIQVIGNVYNTPQLLDFTDQYNVTEEDFPDTFHQILFGSIYKLHDLGAKEINLTTISDFLSPPGAFLGMNGAILLAFMLSLPANELLIPITLMILTGSGNLQSAAGLGGDLLVSVMTWQMAVCTMVFTLFHWPCATTLMTVYRETNSIKKTAAAFLLPTAVGCMLCLMLRLILQ